MYEQLKNNDLIITNNKINILNYLEKNKIILNLKIMTLKEFKDKYFGYYDERALYYLINKYNYKYGIAKMYLENFLYDNTLKKELEQENLIIKTPLFKESIKRIVVDKNVILDPYIKEKIENYEYLYLKNERLNNRPVVYEFIDIEDEINFIALKIIKLLEKYNINDINLVNFTSEYEIPLTRIFKLYNIPININNKKSIYAIDSVQVFISELKNTYSFEKALKIIKKDEIYNYIVDICNKYSFKNLDNTIIYCIENELKGFDIEQEKLNNAINIVDIDDINENGIYFILGFNQGYIPRIYKDEDYLNDEEKLKVGLLTTTEKNLLEKQKIVEIISNYENIIISYKLNSSNEEYYKSSLIDELDLEIKKIDLNDYNYSNLFNKLKLASKIDNYIKFNQCDNTLGLLFYNYPEIPYLKYDNSYKKINSNSFLKYINNELLLSYSSVDNYFRCGFRYYINNILKLNQYEETLAIFIGNLFHHILSNAFKDEFDFEEQFNNYISSKNFNYKEKFFIDKIKKDLIYIIEILKKQDQETSLKNELYEQKIFVNKDKNIKITFMGIIDKIKYTEINNEEIVAIIDYKTGIPNINLNNMIYGIDMQLPLYLYLIKKQNKNTKIAGFYLQKILHNKLNYDNNLNYEKEREKLYKLEGFSNSDINILSIFDKNYNDSNLIKGMKLTSKGFYSYSKILNDKQMDKICELIDKKIDEAITDIMNVKFDINPKRIGLENVGCNNCKYKDICFMQDKNIIYLKEQNYKEFLGGEEDA